MAYKRRRDAELLPADTNVEAGTSQESKAIDLGGERSDIVLSYSTGGAGTPEVTVEVKYSGNAAWNTLDVEGSNLTQTNTDGEFRVERPIEQIRLLFTETGATNAITIDSANALAYYDE